jgi:hypothetical protein
MLRRHIFDPSFLEVDPVKRVESSNQQICLRPHGNSWELIQVTGCVSRCQRLRKVRSLLAGDPRRYWTQQSIGQSRAPTRMGAATTTNGIDHQVVEQSRESRALSRRNTRPVSEPEPHSPLGHRPRLLGLAKIPSQRSTSIPTCAQPTRTGVRCVADQATYDIVRMM